MNFHQGIFTCKKARNLETQCHLGNQKIQECQRQIEETWLLAKEEASKLKAAKEVIKALALRVTIIVSNINGHFDEVFTHGNGMCCSIPLSCS